MRRSWNSPHLPRTSLWLSAPASRAVSRRSPSVDVVAASAMVRSCSDELRCRAGPAALGSRHGGFEPVQRDVNGGHRLRDLSRRLGLRLSGRPGSGQLGFEARLPLGGDGLLCDAPGTLHQAAQEPPRARLRAALRRQIGSHGSILSDVRLTLGAAVAVSDIRRTQELATAWRAPGGRHGPSLAIRRRARGCRRGTSWSRPPWGLVQRKALPGSASTRHPPSCLSR